MKVPAASDFRSRLRSPAVASRVGVWLAICFGVCFLTGLVSHYAQAGSQPIPFPTSPAWGYRVTQGLHVTSGVAAVPLLLVKLWAVYPRLFTRPPSGARRVLLHVAERASLAVLVAAALFQLVTGLANSTQWYPWSFSFRPTHHAVAWVAIGALVLHVAVKLVTIRGTLGADVDDATHDRPEATEPGPLTRRGLLRTTWLASAVAVITTAGGSVPLLRRVSIFGVTTGDGPGGIPVNRTAAEAGATAGATSPDYRLTLVGGGREMDLSREELASLPQATESLPIACVEGWSAGATWTGVRMRDLLDLIEAPRDRDVVIRSLQTRYAFGVSTLWANFADDPRTLLALELNGEVLGLDHGFPCRVIAPNRPGVLQTKWVTRIEVL